MIRLNPFFIRSSIHPWRRLPRSCLTHSLYSVSIPSSSGQVFIRRDCRGHRDCRDHRGLNPFFIRSSIHPATSGRRGDGWWRRLNPFFIRSSIHPTRRRWTTRTRSIVSIPSSSGQVFIPGKVSRSLTNSRSPGLNPFFIRSSIHPHLVGAPAAIHPSSLNPFFIRSSIHPGDIPLFASFLLSDAGLNPFFIRSSIHPSSRQTPPAHRSDESQSLLHQVKYSSEHRVLCVRARARKSQSLLHQVKYSSVCHVSGSFRGTAKW